MMKIKSTSLLMAFVVFILLFSCSEDLSFDQADDLTVTPTVASSIFYFESTEEVINQTGIGGGSQFYSVDYEFDAFEETFVSENVLDGAITYQVENTTSKELTITVQFLDAGGNVLDTETFAIQPGPNSLIDREVAYGNGGKDLDIVRNTSSIRVIAQNLGDATSESSEADPKIILRSSAEFRLELLP